MLHHPKGFEIFCETVKRVGSQISEEIEQGIICDALVLRECFLSARHSITFHGVDKEANFLKQAGHLCFWIVKLKPLDFTTGAAEFVKELITAKVGLLGFRSSVDLDPALEVVARSLKKASAAFPVNEYCGLLFGHTLAIEGLHTIATGYANSGDPVTYTKIHEAIKQFNSRYEQVAHRVVKSFRVNNYSARGTATMFEWAYERPAN